MCRSKVKQVILVISDNSQQRFWLFWFHFLWWDCLGALTESSDGGSCMSLKTLHFSFLALHPDTATRDCMLCTGGTGLGSPLCLCWWGESLRTNPWRFAGNPEYTLDRSTSLINDLHAVVLERQWKEKLVPAFCMTAYWQDSCRSDICVNRSSPSLNSFKATSQMLYLSGFRVVWTGGCFTITLKAEHQQRQECKGLQVGRRGWNKWVYVSVAYLLQLWGVRLGLCSYFLNSLCILS